MFLGPPVPLYLLGARMLEAFPIVPLLGNQGLGVAALSYDGQLTLGIYSNPEVVPDVVVFCEGVRRPSTCSKGDRSLGHRTLVPRGGTEKN